MASATLKRGGCFFYMDKPLEKTPFVKPPLFYQDQLALLRERGMRVDDEKEAVRALEHLNYYRLRAYWLPLEADRNSHQFKQDAVFSDVIRRYEFDRLLRLLVLDAIERIEVSFRARFAFEVAHHHGPHAHLNPDLAKCYLNWHKNLGVLMREVNKSDEEFILHHKSRYVEPLPPVWVVVEVVSFGLLSKLFDNLKPRPTREAIAEGYGVDDTILISWLRHLTLIRNTGAHHARLWNREFIVTPKLIKKKPEILAGIFNPLSRRLYNTLILLLFLLDTIFPDHTLRRDLFTLLSQYPDYCSSMDFPDGWEKQGIWSNCV
jgi:abortive infection bacteriophage resistance protein